MTDNAEKLLTHKEVSSRGGFARAKKLSAAERSEIASRGGKNSAAAKKLKKSRRKAKSN